MYPPEMTITANELHLDKFVFDAADFDDDFDDDDWRSGDYTVEDMKIATATNPAYREALIAQRRARHDQVVQQWIKGLEPTIS